MKMILAMSIAFSLVYWLAPAYRPHDPDFVANYYLGALVMTWGTIFATWAAYHIFRALLDRDVLVGIGRDARNLFVWIACLVGPLFFYLQFIR
jgi:hypothetical protein